MIWRVILKTDTFDTVAGYDIIAASGTGSVVARIVTIIFIVFGVVSVDCNEAMINVWIFITSLEMCDFRVFTVQKYFYLGYLFKKFFAFFDAKKRKRRFDEKAN